jgi:hypothetical protein
VKEPKEIVYVTWLDSSGQSGWNRILPDEESLTCVSVGWLLEETDLSIALATSYGCRVNHDDARGDDISVDDCIRIPKVAILRMDRRKAANWLTWRLPPGAGQANGNRRLDSQSRRLEDATA